MGLCYRNMADSFIRPVKPLLDVRQLVNLQMAVLRFDEQTSCS